VEAFVAPPPSRWHIPVVADPTPPRPTPVKSRPARLVLWSIYFVFGVTVSGIFLVSVARNVRSHGDRPPAVGPLPTRAVLRVCFADLEALQREQDQRMWTVAQDFATPDPVARWNGWSKGWEAKVDDLTDRCHLDSDSDPELRTERNELAGARDALLALHRAYTAQVNRFADDAGDLARAVAEAMTHARDAIVK
jgi:hypothetical protein